MLEHRVAKLAAAATFLLLVIGGTVNPTGSSLACPEPTLVCHGQLFPPMVGGVLYEHGHRLAAMTVGLLQIALTVLLLRKRPSQARTASGQSVKRSTSTLNALVRIKPCGSKMTPLTGGTSR